ncbi:putative cytochrome P450 301a1, mitochondrial [Babylonia areolata]|uniref:putative cytochrome P450 301a1, mitochondrial n=1 Tax=Babylonia areolata TaxID=304850 RepID=UPI003FD69F2C
MFSLLESELSRGVLLAARTNIRALSPCRLRSRSRVTSLLGSESFRPRSCSCQNRGREVAKGNGPTLFTLPLRLSSLVGEPHPAQKSFVRGYASTGSSRVIRVYPAPPASSKKVPSSPPSSSASPPSSGRPRSNTPSPPPRTSFTFSGPPSAASAFMQARPYEEIPGPTAIYQTVPVAGARLLYHPFTNFPAENMSNMLNKLQSTYGPIMRVRLGNEWVVIIENMEDIENVVRAVDAEQSSSISSTQQLESHGILGKLKKTVGDSAMSWLGHQKPALESTKNGQTTEPIKDDKDYGVVWMWGAKEGCKWSYLNKQEEMAQDLVQSLDQLQHNPKEVQTLFHRYSIECLSHMCFGSRMGLLKPEFQTNEDKQKLVQSYRELVKCLGETMSGTRVLHMIFDDPLAKRFRESKQVVNTWERLMMRDAATDNAAAKAAKKAMTPTRGEPSLLRALRKEKSLGEEDIFNAMHALLTVGSDSVSSTLQMMLYALATNPDKQDKLASEIRNFVGPNSQLDIAALQSMQYLQAAVQESLRLHFPMPAGGRVVLSKNIVLSDYFVPADTPIVVNSRRTAKNPKWFEHPHNYRPERWLEENAQRIPPMAFMPFGFKSNYCPGRAFAMKELNVAVVKILQKFRVNLPPEYQGKHVGTVYGLFLSPSEPLPFFFTHRVDPSCRHK